MSDVIGRKNIRTRKPHHCFGCGREFPSGTKMERSAVVDGGHMWTCYLCATCQTVCCDLDWGDEFGYGELRDQALELEAQKSGS